MAIGHPVGAVNDGFVVATVIGSVTVAVVLCASVTLKVTFVGPPALVGVPVIAPVELFRLRPAGRAQVVGQLHV